jgi:hypothetical protein
VQPVQYLNSVDVTFDPFGLTVPFTVAPLLVIALAEPVTGVGASGVVNVFCTLLQVVPSLLVAESLK